MERRASPLVGSIAAAIEERIQSGAYPVGSRLPPERDLSIEFEASRMVVRGAIEVLYRRGLVDRKPGCRPVVQTSSKGRGVRLASLRHTLALWLIHRPTDAERMAMLYGIQKAIDPEGYRLLIENATGDNWEAIAEAEKRFLDRLAHEKDVAGAILWYVGGEKNFPGLERARAHGISLVFLDRTPPPGFEADHVGVDNFFSAQQAVQHLIDHGHRRIAHITNQDNASTVAERLEGYRRALMLAGIPLDEELVVAVAGSDQELEEQSRMLAERLLSLDDPPTAIFAVNDRTAFGMLEALEALGRKVPEDIALVGFDGIERLSPGPSFLTTVNQPFERIGARAVDLLLQRIHEGDGAAYRHVLLEAHLSVHRSSRVRRGEHAPQLTQSLEVH